MMFRGELREELRDRDAENPLNLIRVMPAKGQEYLPVPARPATALSQRKSAPPFARRENT
jgi:hypothetical protein